MKIIKIILSICIVLLLSVSNCSYATESTSTESTKTDEKKSSISETFSTAEDWISNARKNTKYTMSSQAVSTMSGNLYNILLAVGTGIAVVVGAILAIQYMTSGIDKKTQVKEALLPYIVSCIVIFGSLGIWKLTVTILSSIDTSSGSSTSTTTESSGHGGASSGGTQRTQSSSSAHGSSGTF